MADRQLNIELPLDKMLYFIIEMFVHDIVHDMHLSTQLPRVLGVQSKLGSSFFPPRSQLPLNTMIGAFGGGGQNGGTALVSNKPFGPERTLENLGNLIGRDI